MSGDDWTTDELNALHAEIMAAANAAASGNALWQYRTQPLPVQPSVPSPQAFAPIQNISPAAQPGPAGRQALLPAIGRLTPFRYPRVAAAIAGALLVAFVAWQVFGTAAPYGDSGKPVVAPRPLRPVAVAEPKPAPLPVPNPTHPALPPPLPPQTILPQPQTPIPQMPAAPETSPAVQQPVLASPPADALPEFYYLSRSTQVMSRPGTSGAWVVATFPRGASVQGKWQPGTDKHWFRIATPDGLIGFIPRQALSTWPLPSLATLYNRRMPVRRAGPIYASPNARSETIDTAARGRILLAVGTTQTGWMEIALDGGGIGYMPENAFEKPSPLIGKPEVVDTSTLIVSGTTVHLSGVVGFGGFPAMTLRAYIEKQGDTVSCTEELNGMYLCSTASGVDLGGAAVRNGVARAAPNAPSSYRKDEALAQAEQQGIWDPSEAR